MAAPDYVNLNARLAYHFAMVDAFVSPVPENNFINFRFRGGGAGEEPRRPSEEGLATLGSLMGCARQLDMLMQDEAAMRRFVERFLQGDYAAFT